MQSADMFAIYLRPRSRSGPGDVMALVDQNQSRWLGAHCTLCSFAPKPSSGLANAHGTSLTKALHQIARAAKDASSSVESASSEMFVDTSSVGVEDPAAPRPSFVSNPDLVQLPPTPALYAIVGAVLACSLKGARAVEDLHISLGSLGEEAGMLAANSIAACEQWELTIAKCQANESVRA
eukprot:SAG31_NODE_2865_length_4981_cov_4.988529_1_plen_180_part_00